MSYLNISQAAWSLVLSKDPRIKPKPATPEAACSSLQDKADADPITTTAAHQHTKGNASSVATASLRNSICMHSKHDALVQANIAAESSSPSCSKQCDTQIKAVQKQLKSTVEDEHQPTLPLELKVDAAASAVPAPTVWSPGRGEQPSRWLLAAHGPAWQEEAAATARQAAAAHRQLLGLLEQRRAALLKELGCARDLDLKRLLQLVTTYTDDVQALLESGHKCALHAQQRYVQNLTATAAAAVGSSIEAALQAAHKTHQQQVSLLQQSVTAKLEAARMSAKQELTAALELQQQQSRQQLEQQTMQLHDSWSGRCMLAEAAAEKESALRAHADTECNKLRAELASVRREFANCRARWERGGSAAGASSSTSGFNMSSSMAGTPDLSSARAAEGSGGRACSLGTAASGCLAAAFDFSGNAHCRTSRHAQVE